MLRTAALGLSALLALGCAAESVGLTEQDLETIRAEIRRTYNRDLAAQAELLGCNPEWNLGIQDLFLEIKDGEASGLIEYWSSDCSTFSAEPIKEFCNVTVYDNGSWLWKCEQ